MVSQNRTNKASHIFTDILSNIPFERVQKSTVKTLIETERNQVLEPTAQ
jgi:hypothetical protein